MLFGFFVVAFRSQERRVFTEPTTRLESDVECLNHVENICISNNRRSKRRPDVQRRRWRDCGRSRTRSENRDTDRSGNRRKVCFHRPSADRRTGVDMALLEWNGRARAFSDIRALPFGEGAGGSDEGVSRRFCLGSERRPPKRHTCRCRSCACHVYLWVGESVDRSRVRRAFVEWSSYRRARRGLRVRHQSGAIYARQKRRSSRDGWVAVCARRQRRSS